MHENVEKEVTRAPKEVGSDFDWELRNLHEQRPPVDSTDRVAPTYSISWLWDQRGAPGYHVVLKKQHLGGKQFAENDEVQHEVLLWMRQLPKELYAAKIGASEK
ncbi:hypothetical protein TNIN_444421 [Trichonephila inaurata madagascariensis]|uniref:Uncharacterized protein n=1 Tax=Trichonephila inaurata madagascariensis TaxID=2747483 RepID=A0A8X6X6Y8_9ARAC|nr:hypothetical protein TNIN_444421 [Trichonephila inaurata madagascariensis]